MTAAMSPADERAEAVDAFRGLWNALGLTLILLPVVFACIRWTADGWLVLSLIGLFMLITTADWDES